MTSTSAVMLCSAQKSSISWVSAMPPMSEPASCGVRTIRLNAGRERLLPARRRAYRAVAAEQLEIRVEVVIGGDGVEDEVEAAGMLPHFVGIARDDDFFGAEAQRVLPLAGRRGEDDNVRAERMSKLHAHVAKSAETDDADLCPLPTPQWRRGE